MSDPESPSLLHRPPEEPAARRWFWGLLIVATVLAGGLRWYGLGTGDLWIDEVWTVREASQIHTTFRPTRYFGYLSTGVVLAAKGLLHPEISLDNIGQWQAKGLTRFDLRIGPMLIGLVSVPILGLALRRVFGSAIAGVFMLLLALAPWHLYWSQLARYYSLKFLLLGLAITWYYDATRRGSPTRVVAALVLIYFTFLVHPLGILIGVALGIDWLIGRLRGQPVALGKAGWIAGISVPFVAVGTFLAGQALAPLEFDHLVGKEVELGQSGPLVIANTLYMIQPTVVILALASAWWLIRRSRQAPTPSAATDDTRAGWYWLLVAACPTLSIAAFGLANQFAHSRYTFESLFGVLVLASVGCVLAFRRLKPIAGPIVASAPVAILLAAMMLLNAQYHTTGEQFHRRWADAFDRVAQLRQPGENVASGRSIVARYYLQDDTVDQIPGVRYALDERAQGKPLWIVELTGSALGTNPFRFAEHCELIDAFPIRVWQPYSELRVYRYAPRPEAIWRAEKEAAEEGMTPEELEAAKKGKV